MVGGGLWVVNLDVCGENDVSGMAVMGGVDWAVEMVVGDV